MLVVVVMMMMIRWMNCNACLYIPMTQQKIRLDGNVYLSKATRRYKVILTLRHVCFQSSGLVQKRYVATFPQTTHHFAASPAASRSRTLT